MMTQKLDGFMHEGLYLGQQKWEKFDIKCRKINGRITPLCIQEF